MIFIEHASFNDATIKDNFGAPEYSYHFVRRAFEGVLNRLGRCVEVADPEREVDAIFHAARARGEDCLFLSYNPPHKTVLGLACPTAPVFAWEYDRIPDETWNGDPRNDWRHVLARTGLAITHCQTSAEAVRRSMGADYPIWVAPAPLFDRFTALRTEARGWREPFDLPIEGAVAISAGETDLSAFRPERPRSEGERALRLLERTVLDAELRPPPLRLEGVVYTAVLAPHDGRKNWPDLVTAFVWAFRRTPEATLVLKLTNAFIEDGLARLLACLSTLGEFECRVVLVHGMLSNEAYAQLIDATSYAVNASTGEGQCLPLMEYMSCGRPAVAPAHTAMRDYIGPENAFVIASDLRPSAWPQDQRAVIRCHHHQVRFADLVRQYRESYRVAKDQAQYARMSEAAVRSVQAFCSEEVVTSRMTDLLAWLKSSASTERRTA
jgi:glycosyltransferase involved in cell wall biosynthesis